MMMGAIKDLVDLYTQLDASVKDRKTRDLFLPLKEKIVDVRAEMLELKEQQASTIEKLKAEHARALADLRQQHARELDEVRAELAAVVAAKPQVSAEFSDKTGTYVDAATGRHYCPQCWTSKEHRAIPMQDNGHGWTCGSCGKDCSDPKRRPKIGVVSLG